MVKKLFVVVLIVAGGVLIWTAFALWTGIYSVYSYPPGREHPEGKTLLVSREPGEPMFNSPDAPAAAPKKKDASSGGIGFAPMPKSKKPIEKRLILELPYIEWAYNESLKPQEPQ